MKSHQTQHLFSLFFFLSFFCYSRTFLSLFTMSYPYSLPTTGALSFTDYLETASPYSSEISDATAQRGRLRTVLKELKKESQSARDYQVIINVNISLV